MAVSDALKRLGGGRWETRDGRFQIEPQSGTWVVVDTTQTNEFGLPLVRGPFGSLTSAREAIEAARDAGPLESPLAERIEQARRESPTAPMPKATTTSKGRAAPTAEPPPEPGPEPEPEPPPGPKWIRNLSPTDRRRATAVIARLEGLGIDGADEIARAEIAGRQPALARLSIERRLRAAARSAVDPRAAVTAAAEVILGGKDDDIGAEWHLVDGHGRRIEAIDPVD